MCVEDYDSSLLALGLSCVGSIMRERHRITESDTDENGLGVPVFWLSTDMIERLHLLAVKWQDCAQRAEFMGGDSVANQNANS